LEQLPAALRGLAYIFPTTHAVSLMEGIWGGSGWVAHWESAGALVLIFLVCIVLSTKFFRWE